jgi:hypothetical protein
MRTLNKLSIVGLLLFAGIMTSGLAQTASPKIKPDLSGWPKASRMAGEEMMKKYGEPDVAGKEMLGWKDAGPWAMIHVDKEETKHSFPIEHTDMLEQSISYKVPADKFDELGEFDGSVVVDRTQGLLSARCDMEANNFLALNLAHDIINGKKSVAEARKAYGDIIKEKMNGGNPEYMLKLTFEPKDQAGDPDKNTTGLTKEDVLKKTKG